jgi:hypothetical protein
MLVSALLMLIPLVVVAAAPEVLVARFDGGIGVDPVSGMSTAAPCSVAAPCPVANVVRGVPPGGIPWHIGDFHARVRQDGHIFVEGRHLVLAGGNSLGQSLGASVQAQLFCGLPPTSTSVSPGYTTPITTTAVTLTPDGDFRLDEMLSPTPPDPCDDPVLLIVSAANGHWFAAGVPQTNLTVKPRRWRPRPQ